MFSLKEFGVIEVTGSDFTISDLYMDLHTHSQEEPAFNERAYEAVLRSALFSDLIEGFRGKLPEKTSIALRLERERRFNTEKSKIVASVIEDSLRFAGVLDKQNHIIPPRSASPISEQIPVREDERTYHNQAAAERESSSLFEPPKGYLPTIVPLANKRNVIVYYPPDLALDEAKKVGKVLEILVE